MFAEWSGIPAEAMADWTMIPLTVDGEVRAVAAMQGTEIHFVIAPQWRGRTITPKRTRQFLAPLFDVAGFLTTRSTDPAKHDFLGRIGFDRTRSDGAVDYYMMSELPFGKRET